MSERLARDIVVTWPKTRPLEDYLRDLGEAYRKGLLVNFRVPTLPNFEAGAFDYGASVVCCYRVYDGQVVGFLRLLRAEFRGAGEVERVPAASAGLHEGCQRRGGVCDCQGRPCALDYWPPGNYLVCDPEWWTLVPPEPMRGFRGWRWFERPT